MYHRRQKLIFVSNRGEPGSRFALPNSSIMIHQPSGGAGGQASDIGIVATEILRIRAKMFELYADHCSGLDERREDALARFGECFAFV